MSLFRYRSRKEIISNLQPKSLLYDISLFHHTFSINKQGIKNNKKDTVFAFTTKITYILDEKSWKRLLLRKFYKCS